LIRFDGDTTVLEVSFVAINREDKLNRQLKLFDFELATTGYNFCWFEPQKKQGRCYLQIRSGSESRDALLSMLQEGGFSPSTHAGDYVPSA
jgi:hypothetical protein